MSVIGPRPQLVRDIAEALIMRRMYRNIKSIHLDFIKRIVKCIFSIVHTLNDGTKLNLSDKDQKWQRLKETFKF